MKKYDERTNVAIPKLAEMPSMYHSCKEEPVGDKPETPRVSPPSASGPATPEKRHNSTKKATKLPLRKDERTIDAIPKLDLMNEYNDAKDILEKAIPKLDAKTTMATNNPKSKDMLQ